MKNLLSKICVFLFLLISFQLVSLSAYCQNSCQPAAQKHYKTLKFHHDHDHQPRHMAKNQRHVLPYLVAEINPNDEALNPKVFPDFLKSTQFFPKKMTLSSKIFDGQHFAFHQKINFFALKNSFLI